MCKVENRKVTNNVSELRISEEQYGALPKGFTAHMDSVFKCLISHLMFLAKFHSV